MKEKLSAWKNKYLTFLENSFIPYWSDMFDKNGAIINCIAEDKTVISYDRYIWSQGRALWTFSALYNRVKKDPALLDRAHGLFQYLCSIEPENGGNWNFRYDREGNVLDADTSIYVDGFVLAGMTEYYLATGNEKAKEIGLKIYENTRKRIENPGSYTVEPDSIPAGMKLHGVNMMFSFFNYHFGRVIGNDEICRFAVSLADEILDKFYREETGALCEYIWVDGHYGDTPMERACIPGHVIECMWFLLTIYDEEKNEDRIKQCCRLIKQHIEYGYDKEHGGIWHAFDVKGIEPCFIEKATYKPWWVQTETMVATLAANLYTDDDWFLSMHEDIADYTFERYSNGYGDFINWLDKDGNVAPTAALPVKDPFHVPRSLIMSVEYIDRILEK